MDAAATEGGRYTECGSLFWELGSGETGFCLAVESELAMIRAETQRGRASARARMPLANPFVRSFVSCCVIVVHS